MKFYDRDREPELERVALLLLKEQKERRVDSSIRCCVVEVQEEKHWQVSIAFGN